MPIKVVRGSTSVTIDRASADVTLTSRPSVLAPTIEGSAASPAASAVFRSGAFAATGGVRLDGVSGDDPAGWQLGFVQVQWIETNWVYYRRQANSDGSLFIQRGKPPARPRQGCRDCVNSSPVANVWYASVLNGLPPGGAFPTTLACSFEDTPSESARLVETNTLTGRTNFLREAQLEFHFCTVLAVQDPAGTFHQLLSFNWNLRWQARFLPTNFASVATTPWRIDLVPNGNGANVSRIFQGGATDPKFRDLVTGPETQSCNAMASAAKTVAGTVGSTARRQSRVWDNFDVRR